jgi:hypothetical protein
MSLYLALGGPATEISSTELKSLLFESLDKLGERRRVLVIPPDITRLHSRAGELTRYAWEYYGERLAAVLPALGTHAPLSNEQLTRMFGDVPQHLFHIHNWRTEIETHGRRCPAEFIERTIGRQAATFRMARAGQSPRPRKEASISSCPSARLCRMKSLAWPTTPKTF